MADGPLFIAEVDRHAIHAIDAGSGERLWSYTAGGRIDSPPTYDRGRLLFGSANGYVYCLRASDGALAWRFRAAPHDRRIVAYGQLESAWPVPSCSGCSAVATSGASSWSAIEAATSGAWWPTTTAIELSGSSASEASDQSRSDRPAA